MSHSKKNSARYYHNCPLVLMYSARYSCQIFIKLGFSSTDFQKKNPLIFFTNFHSCTVHLVTIQPFIYPTDAQLDFSKNVKIYIKIYMRGAATCFGFSQPGLGLRVRIPPVAWMSLFCECCVLSGRGLCIGPITRPEESYRMWCV